MQPRHISDLKHAAAARRKAEQGHKSEQHMQLRQLLQQQTQQQIAGAAAAASGKAAGVLAAEDASADGQSLKVVHASVLNEDRVSAGATAANRESNIWATGQAQQQFQGEAPEMIC